MDYRNEKKHNSKRGKITKKLQENENSGEKSPQSQFSIGFETNQTEINSVGFFTYKILLY